MPFYLRVNVLSKYTDDGWGLASHGDTSSIGGDQYPIQAGGTPNAVELEARVRISGMTGNPPVFGTPTAIDGLSQDTTWSQQDQILLGSTLDEVRSGLGEQVVEPGVLGGQAEAHVSAPKGSRSAVANKATACRPDPRHRRFTPHLPAVRPWDTWDEEAGGAGG